MSDRTQSALNFLVLLSPLKQGASYGRENVGKSLRIIEAGVLQGKDSDIDQIDGQADRAVDG